MKKSILFNFCECVNPVNAAYIGTTSLSAIESMTGLGFSYSIMSFSPGFELGAGHSTKNIGFYLSLWGDFFATKKNVLGSSSFGSLVESSKINTVTSTSAKSFSTTASGNSSLYNTLSSILGGSSGTTHNLLTSSHFQILQLLYIIYKD